MEEEHVGAEAEQAERVEGEPVPRVHSGEFRRLLVRGLLLGIVAGTVAVLASGWPAAVGVVAGSVAAAVYCWGYLRSHLGHLGRTRIFDPALARQSIARIAALAIVGVGMRLAGRMPFIGYLIGFAIAFAVLVALEAPAVARRFKADGLTG